MFVCEQCTYSTKIKCNFMRHLKTCKKRGGNDEIVPEKVHYSPEKVHYSPEKVHYFQEKANSYPEKVHFLLQCAKCEKRFSRKDNLTNHENICFGVNHRQCKTCLKLFASAQSKWNHMKNVKCVPPSMRETSPSAIINNNITNSTINNITNNINIQQFNINVHGNENYDVLLDVIRNKYPQAFVSMMEEGDTASLLKLVHFNKDFPENQTIRKQVKKDVSSEVHIGEGRWEKRPTQHVIDTFRDQTSKRIYDSLATNAESVMDRTRDTYLKEIIYEQSKTPTGNTDSLLFPFIRTDEEIAEKELIEEVQKIRWNLVLEYPSLMGTKMLTNQWKRSARPLIHKYENKWNTVVDIRWT